MVSALNLYLRCDLLPSAARPIVATYSLRISASAYTVCVMVSEPRVQNGGRAFFLGGGGGGGGGCILGCKTGFEAFPKKSQTRF